MLSLCSENYLDKKIKKYMYAYFEDKATAEDIEIFSKKYINKCLSEDICSAVDKAYLMMKRDGRFQENISPIGEDVRFVIKILNKIRRTVPKEYCAGVFLMHLDLIENIN